MGFTRNIARDRAVLGGLLGRLGLPGTLQSPLLAHALAVRREASRLGLLADDDVDDVVPRHSADSLLFAMVRRPQPGERWVDVGSGAGFPGLVLAIGFPASDFTLVEPMQRRAGFLELCVADLGLRNVSTRTGRTGVLSQAGFDVAVARALKEPGAAVDDLARLVRIGGAVILAIGPTAKVAPPARIVRVEVPGNVDSPGLFSMMTHRG